MKCLSNDKETEIIWRWNQQQHLRVLKIMAHKHSASQPDKPDADQTNNKYVNKRFKEATVVTWR